jgi:DUF4097 and DUF4098 domain-containing protein YvlB
MASRVAAVLLMCAAPSPALAQRFEFERTFEMAAPATLEVTTLNGAIEILPGEAGRVVVQGAATVRIGWDVPVNAVELARQIAAAPPIEQVGATLRLRLPTDRAAQRAATVSYRVRIPPDMEIRSTSESGATSIRGTTAPVWARTQSAAITVSDLAGAVQVSTGSGAVVASDISGALSVTTQSSAFTASRLRSSLRVRTGSGAVSAAFDGGGDVDVETSSSGIDLRGVRGGLTVQTQSGGVTVRGAPAKDWSVTTGSSSVSLHLEPGVGFRLDAESRSGSVVFDDLRVDGATTKRSALGTVGTGGPSVHVRTGSGAIRVTGRE